MEFHGKTWTKVVSSLEINNASWSQATVDLSNFSVTKLRFSGSRGSGYRSDIALDDIVVSYQNSVRYTLGQLMQ